MEILAIEGLTKNFYLHNLGKTIKSCRDIGFTLHEGEFIGIVGRSGAGKSSILMYQPYLSAAAGYDRL